MENGDQFKAKYALAVVAILWYIAIASMCVIGCVVARRRYRLRPRSPLCSLPAAQVPGVSIIRPLKGLDPNIFENLESTFTQEYSNYEILFAIADENDPVLPLVRDLCAKNPTIPTRVVVGDENVGVNPKVNNLVRPFALARHDFVWILDSGVQVPPGVLARSVDALVNQRMDSKRQLGLVHHVPFALSHSADTTHYWGSRLEEVYLNTNHAKMYIALNTLSIDSCVVGKSNLYRRSDAERLTGTLKPYDPTDASAIRGLPAFGKYLAEDNMIAGAIWHELNLRHTLSCDVAANNIGEMTLSAYVQRRIRWIRVRKHMVLLATLIEPLTECFVVSITSSWAASYLFNFPPWLFLPLNICAWLWIDLDVFSSLAGHPLPAQRRFAFLVSWTLRELLAFPIWITAIIGDKVEWRGISYRVRKNGAVEKLTSHNKRASWFSSRVPSKQNYESLADEPT